MSQPKILFTPFIDYWDLLYFINKCVVRRADVSHIAALMLLEEEEGLVESVDGNMVVTEEGHDAIRAMETKQGTHPENW